MSAWTGQPGQDREDRMPVLDTQDQTVGTGDLGIRAMEQDSWAGQAGQDRTAVGDGKDRMARKGNRGQDGQT